ncbi:MAG: uridine kinase [Natronohydrobacter sp.]|nr:uridine kinase [Natronohydrobacter sp.]
MRDVDSNTAAVLDLVERTELRKGQRKMIGIAGPPGSGKSTLAEQIVAQLNAREPGQAALVPMDGFHLDNETLDRASLRPMKGAPQTFDARGFVAKVAELQARGIARSFPLFDRSADCTLQDAGTVGSEATTIVVEGNYLLLQQHPWEELRSLLDATVMLKPSFEILEKRLIDRWVSHGLSVEAAFQKAHGNDLRNARHVLENSISADLTLTPDQGRPG